ncbi:hypothetical protein [Flavobacterium sp. 3HN19-14]|uniref:hypothetical protein n=1 Tax=Flavobacterium sp. 3HN19-14 TaxID=3448133 RepID=UPI003EDF3BF8
MFSLLLISCSANKAPAATDILSVSFGSSGGFTGITESYTLTSEKKLFRKQQFINEISAEKANHLLSEAASVKDYVYSKPGNLSYFIEIKTKEKTNRIVWAATTSMAPDQKIITLYDHLISATK